MAATNEGEALNRAQDTEYVGDGLRGVDLKPLPPIEKLKRTRALLVDHIAQIDAVLEMEVKFPGFLELSKTARKFL